MTNNVSFTSLSLEAAPEQIDYHVKTGDYFAHLATLLGFLEEAIRTNNGSRDELSMAEEMRRDLQFMHSRYQIAAKPAEAWIPIRKSGNVL